MELIEIAKKNLKDYLSDNMAAKITDINADLTDITLANIANYQVNENPYQQL